MTATMGHTDEQIPVFWYPPPDRDAREACEQAIAYVLRAPRTILGEITVQLSRRRDGVLSVSVSRRTRPGAKPVRDAELTFRVVSAVQDLGFEALPAH
jgi:hypothetical protein